MDDEDEWLGVRMPLEAAQNIAGAIAGPDPAQRLIEQWRIKRAEQRWSHPHPLAKTERNAAIVQMRQVGMTHRQIAEAHGISHSRVKRLLDNWQQKKPRW